MTYFINSLLVPRSPMMTVVKCKGKFCLRLW